MDRRKFMGSVAGGLLAVPLAARAQKSTTPVIGFVNSGSPALWERPLRSFRQGLSEIGYVEGQNVAIEYRWADGQYDRLPALVADLIRRQVRVIVATTTNAALAAKAATATIPIVFTTAGDPVELGVVASLGRPGGNTTGVTIVTSELTAKRLELLHELVPKATAIALLMNPDSRLAKSAAKAAQEAARSLGLQLHVLRAHTEQDIDEAFATLVRLRAGALFVASDAFFTLRREQIVELAARHAVPTIYEFREFVMAGGLMSYGTSLPEAYRQAGIYTGKILNGAKPMDLPVQQSTKFEMVINTKTAKALGLTIPQSLGVQAELIE